MAEFNGPRPLVGVGAIIIKDGKILFGKRKNSHGSGTWTCPGGHLEFREEIFDCARRETLEEAGVKIKNLKMGPVTSDIFEKEGKHFITLFVIADYDSGEVQLLEPDFFEEWDWFSWDNLPRPLFLPYQNLFNQGFNPLNY